VILSGHHPLDFAVTMRGGNWESWVEGRKEERRERERGEEGEWREGGGRRREGQSAAN
jgi:hypothetical protein